MKEKVKLKCGKDISDIALFCKRVGRYVDAGYQLESFSVKNGLKAVLRVKGKRSIGFKSEED